MGLMDAGGGLSGSKLALANAAEGDVISGKTFYSGNKELKTGTLAERGVETATSAIKWNGDLYYRIPFGAYRTGSGTDGGSEVKFSASTALSVLGANSRPVISEVWCSPDPNQGFARETYDTEYFDSNLTCIKGCTLNIRCTASSNGSGGVRVYVGGSVVLDFAPNTINKTHTTKSVQRYINPGERIRGEFYGDWASWWNLRGFIV